VNLTGGDPLVIPGARALFGEIVARRDRFAALSVSTAGVPAAPAIEGLRAIAAEIDSLDVYVSLDGVGVVHDRVRRRVGAFDQAMAFVSHARRHSGVQLALTCVINRLNVDQLDDLADFAEAEALPVSYAVVNRSDHYIRSLPLYDDVSLTAEQTQRAADFLRRRSRQLLNTELLSVLAGGSRRDPCRLLHDGFLVTSDGTISICGTSQRMILGVLDGRSWAEVAAGRPALMLRGAGDVCRECTSNCYAWRSSDDRDLA
jgi:MoaA/NifB/PqqE/SkfB family radical SAM enzyme